MVTIIKKTAKKREIKKILSSVKPQRINKPFKASLYCGKVKYNEDALTIQKKLRDEWK